jgi:hypothetical protein
MSSVAFISIFLQGTFMTLARSDKRQQLKDLCSIVVGIRLFNRAAGKGGRSITDCRCYGAHTLLATALLHSRPSAPPDLSFSSVKC